jgi:nitroreductase
MLFYQLRHPSSVTPFTNLAAMEVEQAIRSRRTIKAFAPQPLERETLTELLELARWAPNHHLTNPWRFRVIGPQALERLKQAAGELAAADAGRADAAEVARVAAAKLDRAPTLVVCSVVRAEDPIEREEDRHAAAVAAYIVLLAAHGRGLAGYWRTPAVLRTDAGRKAVGMAATEGFVGLLHLGRAKQVAEAPEREPAVRYVSFLD